MNESSAQRVAAERVTGNWAEQDADAARAAERRRLARDLHDSVTQTLISLHLSAQAAADLWETQPAQARAALEMVRHLAAGVTTEMRAVLVDLHDAVLEQHGLVAALEAHCAVVRQRSGLQVDLRVEEAPAGARAGPLSPHARLTADYEAALYYLVREALANVIKHARARSATVTLVWDRWLRICVEDDGRGFGAPVPAFAYGLRGMRERVAALGGPDGRPALALLHRPTFGVRPLWLREDRPSIWISYAPLGPLAAGTPLVFGRHHLLAGPVQDWERLKIGGGAPPVRTPAGWLLLYHGVGGGPRDRGAPPRALTYRVGAMLLDGRDPRQVLYRSAQSILEPQVAAERVGAVPRVVFPTGLDVRADGVLDVYYGMADSRIGVARATLTDLLRPALAQVA
jgi:beta-1,4-mannooligosaccharide phosphorylase/Histidine kinase